MDEVNSPSIGVGANGRVLLVRCQRKVGSDSSAKVLIELIVKDTTLLKEVFLFPMESYEV